MLRLAGRAILVFLCCSLTLAGCGAKKEVGTVEAVQTELSPISCIAVMPAASMGKEQVASVYLPEEENLRRGIQVMNEILSQELGGKEKVRFVGIKQLSALQLSGGENGLTIARMVGESMNCNAVLESTVNRFTERVGGRYSVESPASVAFDMRLISLASSSILWSATFDEVQKSVSENILDWKKASTRGFVWITADELMREGVKEKLAGNPYFNPVGE